MTALALERRFRQEARRSGVPRDVVEKDFALSYALAGIFGVEQLASTLVFKGGTALRKGYFADYRYSEDAEHCAARARPGRLRSRPEPYTLTGPLDGYVYTPGMRPPAPVAPGRRAVVIPRPRP